MLLIRQRVVASRVLGRVRRIVATRVVATVLAALLTLVAVPGIAAAPAFFDDAPVVVGEPAPRTVVATATVRLTDEEATEQARLQAADQVSPVTVTDRDAQQDAVRRTTDLFAYTRTVRDPVPQPAPPAPDPPEVDEDGELLPPPEPPEPVVPSDDEQQEALVGRFPWLPLDAARLLVETPADRLDVLEAETVSAVRAIVLVGFTAAERDSAVSQLLEEQVRVRPLTDEEAAVLLPAVAAGAIDPTRVVDADATETARDDAAAAVEAVAVTFPSGQPVVVRGEEVTERQVAALAQLGLLGTNPWLQVLRLLAVTLIAATAAAALLFRREEAWARPRLMPAAAFWLVVFAAALATAAFARSSSLVVVWALPAGAVSLLAANVFGRRAGAAFPLPMALLTLVVLPGRADLAAAVLVGSALTALFAGMFTSRRRMRLAVVSAVAVYGVVAAVASVAVPTASPAPAWWLVFAAAALTTLGGLLVGVGLLPFVEAVFGVTTPAGLLDLEDRNHPLLRRLQDEAPGSYNHSVLVSTLARRAAEGVGADGQMVAVQAMYHDIGKVARPQFFVENQLGIGNPHDELTPEVSAEIIHAHVTDGVKLARRYRLPPEIVDGIATHHGTSLVAFFYRRAVADSRDAGDDDPDEGMFRYPGRKPFTKETAILMLADCCEGASRAAALDHRLSEDEIVALVDGLVDDRVADGQLDESPLTLADLASVKRSLADSLMGVYHPRIPYPDKPTETP